MTAPPLPHTFRPLGARIAAYALTAVLFGTAIGIWLAFPPEIREQFTAFQIGTVLFFGVAAAVAAYALGRCRVVARDSGVVIVNGYRSRRYEWSELVAVSLRPGSPFAVVDLGDGTTVSAMGIQGSDGGFAQRQVRELRALVEERTRTERND